MPAPIVIGVTPYQNSPATLGSNDTHHCYYAPKVYATAGATLTIGFKRDGQVVTTITWNPSLPDLAPIQWVGQLVFTWTGTVQVHLV